MYPDTPTHLPTYTKPRMAGVWHAAAANAEVTDTDTDSTLNLSLWVQNPCHIYIEKAEVKLGEYAFAIYVEEK